MKYAEAVGVSSGDIGPLIEFFAGNECVAQVELTQQAADELFNLLKEDYEERGYDQ